MNIDKLKDEYAKSKGYDSWAGLRNRFTMNPFDMGMHENKCIEYCIELKNNGALGDVSVSNSFDIHNCINDIEEVIKNKLSGWMFIKGTIRYEIKKAIDKMLYSR